MATVPFHFITPVWGEEFTRVFLKASLPSQLSSGNLGCFRGGGDKYKIFTTSRDALTIRESPAYSLLAEFVTPEIHLIDDWVRDYRAQKINRYQMISLCHGRGIEEARREDTALVFLCADLFFADGSFSHLRNLMMAEKRLVCAGGYRVVAESFLPALLGRSHSLQEGLVSITSRDLVKLSLDHIHPESKTLFWNSPTFQEWPAYLYWDAKGEGILQRGIHLCPIMIRPSKKEEQLSIAEGMGIDGSDYMARAVPDFRDAHVIEDSDEFFFVSLMAQAESPQFLPPSFMGVASWILKHCSPYHLRFLDHRLRFHHRDLSPGWKRVEEESERVVSSIKEGLAFFEKYPEFRKEFDEQRGRAREFLTAKPLQESYKGYNLTQSGGKYFAFAPALGGLEPALLSEGQLTSWFREGKAFRAGTLVELKSHIDESGFVAEMVLLEEGYEQYNIIQYLDHFYGLAQAQGKVDFAQMSPGELESLHQQGKCFQGADITQVKGLIDQWVKWKKSHQGMGTNIDPLRLAKEEERNRAQEFIKALLAAAPNFSRVSGARPAELTPAFFGLLSQKIRDLRREGELQSARRLEILRECLQELAPPPRESPGV